MRVPAVLARRFVAGENATDAVSAGLRLHARGIGATFDRLGEDAHDRAAVRRTAEANKELLRLIPGHVQRNISIKLTSLGLDISPDFCREQMAEILQLARQQEAFVRVDMEGSRHTRSTLDVFHALRRDFDNVGIVLQAYLHRTEADVREAIQRGDRVRLCKGAYKEPASIAFQSMDDVRRNFRCCARLLLDSGNFHALATHDESLIQDALEYAHERAIPPERYEFQMLYGLRPKRWDALVASGHNVRVYVPYGTHWLPYFYRRLRERKENVFLVLRGLFS